MKLAHAIVRTLTYYDVMDYPMTGFEVWRHLIYDQTSDVESVGEVSSQWSLSDVRSLLHATEMQAYVDRKNGFYFLAGREEIVDVRMKRQRLSLLKTRKMMRYIMVLRCVPFVRMIGMTGRLALRHAQEESDWDILIVAKSGHIWMCRILVTLCTQLMGVRRYGDRHVDRICLNYYVADNALEVPTKDLYGAHEYSFIIPLFGHEVFRDFVARNVWIKGYKPNYMVHNHTSTWTLKDTFFTKIVRKMGEALFGFTFFEDIVRKFQYAKIMDNPKTRLPGAKIVANDQHLVFLPKPHGPEVFEEYQRRFHALEIPWQKE